MCGVRLTRESKYDSQRGSSPHVRGTVILADTVGLSGRFIPACAGYGPAVSCGFRDSTVHPRMCGVRSCLSGGGPSALGSSPHVRGTGRLDPEGRRPVRFIPACAGYGRRYGVAVKPTTVHPRMCGVRALVSLVTTWDTGSSPHVRGTAHSFDAFDVFCRFIPACAGYGSGTARAWLKSSVHPRMCGVRRRAGPDGQRDHGSSPHVRGTANGRRAVDPESRFIPACAGYGRIHHVKPLP